MMRLTLNIPFMALTLAFAANTAAAAAGWLDLIAQGKNQEAAEVLQKAINQMPLSSDPTYVELLRLTAESVSKGCKECKDENRIVLFRGMAPGLRDAAFEQGKPALFLSKALQNQKLQPDSKGIHLNRTQSPSSMMRDHSVASSMENWRSPFLSSTANPYTAELSSTVAVLKICPQRVLLNTRSLHGAEFEVLIPFFIHPNEVFAVVQLTGDIAGGQFDILYRGDEIKGKTDAEIKKEIKRLAQASQKLTRPRVFREFNGRFEESRKEKMGDHTKSITGALGGDVPHSFKNLEDLAEIKAHYLKLKRHPEVRNAWAELFQATQGLDFRKFESKAVENFLLLLDKDLRGSPSWGHFLNRHWKEIGESTQKKIILSAIREKDHVVLRSLLQESLGPEDMKRSPQIFRQIMDLGDTAVNRNVAEFIFGSAQSKDLEEELIYLIRKAGKNDLPLMRELSENVFAKKHIFKMERAAREFQKKFKTLNPSFQESLSEFFKDNPLLNLGLCADNFSNLSSSKRSPSKKVR